MGYRHTPSPELHAAAQDIERILDQGVEFGPVEEGPVFSLAWRALEEFCRADVEDYVQRTWQTEEEKAAIFLGIKLPETPSEEILKQYNAVYRTAVRGLHKALSGGGPVSEVTDEAVSAFRDVLSQQINQTLPGTYPGFVNSQLANEAESDNESDQFMTRTVTTSVTNHRMWNIITSADAFEKYKKHMTDPDELEARFAAARTVSTPQN